MRDASRDNSPLLLKGETKINVSSPSDINNLFKDTDQLNKTIEKMNDRYDETLNNTFTGGMIQYSPVFNKIGRSVYGTVGDSFKKLIEYNGFFCYIPEANECFKKCIESIYKKDFSQDYCDFKKDSCRCKNTITSAKFQHLGKKYKLDLGFYIIKEKGNLPTTVTKRDFCLFIHNHHFCVIRKTDQTNFTDAITELENNFKYEDNQFSDHIQKQIIEYKFPISYEKNCMLGVFSFDFETLNVKYQINCEPYAAGVCRLNRLYESFKGDLTEKKLETETQNVHVFDRENGNPIVGMINYVINNYKGKAKMITDRYGRKIVIPYNYQMVGHNASGFDNFIVLISIPKPYTNIKIIKRYRGLINLSFKVGDVFVDDRVKPRYMKFVFSKFHTSGSLKTI